jgi:hypothetical protein
MNIFAPRGHVAEVCVPPMTRKQIGMLVCSLGPLKSALSIEWKRNHLKFVFNETGVLGTDGLVNGEIVISSARAGLTRKGIVAIEHIVASILKNHKKNEWQVEN